MYLKKGLEKTSTMCVYCTAAEKRYIEARAKSAGMSASVFLRELGLKDSPGKRKTLPAEVLAFNAELAGIAGILELIANKRLDNEDLDGLQRAELLFRTKELKLLIEKIKSFLQ